MIDRGIVYVARSARYAAEAEVSAARVKAVMPHVPVTVFTDQPLAAPCFDSVMPLEGAGYNARDKILGLQASPYQSTLYLDTDTHLLEDISDVFALLDVFDVAVAHAPRRFFPGWEGWNRVPYAFPQVNGGVIAFRKCPAVDAFLSEWRRLYEAYIQERGEESGRDQPALREALYYSQARIATLAPEYNFRVPYGGYCHGVVKLLHGRHPLLPELAERINQSDRRRFVLIYDEQLVIENIRRHPKPSPPPPSFWSRLRGKLLGLRRA